MSTATPTTSLPKPRRRWVKVLLTLIIFLAGMFAGGALVAGIAINRIQHFVHHPEEAPSRLTTLLRRRLDLSPDQTQKVEEILRARQKSLQGIRREVEPKVSAELQQAKKEISEVLNDAQRTQWEKSFDDMMNRWWVPAPSSTTP